ncbi:VirB4 family type IV secretion system protein [Streptomonospora salina]|uniref:Type IV secretory pathway VirB4 component n=1 Tax=Streptomonospora salina TaxID=104205 RepID=A0A841EDD7_9ACTN|nr:ATP-binding protein [Streptomonospora salina]MBB5998470.1 type IV secretory pathway VirB4 component [Streptomonospora salina]
MRPTAPHREGSSRALDGPSVRLHPRRLDIEGACCQTLVVTGYPREAGPGWAQPLLSYPGRVDVALHIDPVPAPLAATRLRRRRARLESAGRLDAEGGRVEDPHQAAAAHDATELATRVATGQARLFRVSFYLTVHARTVEHLEAEVANLRALAAGLLVDTHPATFRPLHGWLSTLPLATDALAQARTMDTDAIAAALPFASPDLEAELASTSVVYGENIHSGTLVHWDRFSPDLDNHNMVVLARSGAGKSYTAKLELLRSLLVGIEAAVIDPEDEYTRLCSAVGGTRIPLGTPEGRINPFDLPPGDERALSHRCLFAHTLIAAMVGDLGPQEAAALDRAVVTAYARAGITRDPATWNRPAPLLAEVVTALGEDDEQAGTHLAVKLGRYVTGPAATLFDGPTTAPTSTHLTVYTLRHLPEEVRTVGMLLALDRIWNRIDTEEARPRTITVDEGWVLLQNPIGARYLYKLAKAGRKRWCGLTLITQDVGDVLATDLGRAIVANAATSLLLRQAPQNLDALAEAFGLSHGERQIVSTASRGQALLLSGERRAGVCALASPAEDELVTSAPAEVATSADDHATGAHRSAADGTGAIEPPGDGPRTTTDPDTARGDEHAGEDSDDAAEQRGW